MKQDGAGDRSEKILLNRKKKKSGLFFQNMRNILNLILNLTCMSMSIPGRLVSSPPAARKRADMERHYLRKGDKKFSDHDFLRDLAFKGAM